MYCSSNSRGISFLIVLVGYLCCRVLIKSIEDGTECAIGKEQCDFTKGRGYMDHAFAVRQVCQKYLSKTNNVFWAFVDLENVIRLIEMVCGRC